MIFICKNESTIDSVSVQYQNYFFFSNNSFLSNRLSTASITSDVMHDFELEKERILAGRDGCLNLPKQHF